MEEMPNLWMPHLRGILWPSMTDAQAAQVVIKEHPCPGGSSFKVDVYSFKRTTSQTLNNSSQRGSKENRKKEEEASESNLSLVLASAFSARLPRGFALATVGIPWVGSWKGARLIPTRPQWRSGTKRNNLLRYKGEGNPTSPPYCSIGSPDTLVIRWDP